MNFWKTFLAALVAFIVGVVVIFFYLIGSGVSAIMSLSDAKSATPEQSVLYIDLTESIIDAPMLSPLGSFDPVSMTMSQPLTLMQVLTAIEKAAEDPAIAGICIQQEGVGVVSIANIEELRRAIEKFKTSGKFVVAYDDTYTQSEYYLASVADKVLLQPEGSLDWRGMGFNLVFFKGLIDKVGAEVEIFRPSVCKYKSAVEPYFLTEMSDANRLQMQSLADDMWATVVEDVAKSRNMEPEALKSIAANLSVAVAEDAVTYGLVDALAYEDELFEQLVELGAGSDKRSNINKVTLGEYVANEITGTLTIPLGGENPYLLAGDSPLVALIYAEGDIIDGNEKVDGQIVGAALAEELRQARLSDETKAVVVRVNSPGGSALASDIAWREMELLQQAKPVVISMGEMAASGGYYISCPADYIVSNRLTLTGSIGVFGMIPNLHNTLKDKLGITFDEAATSPSASGMTFAKPLNEQQKAAVSRGVDKVYTTFTSHVAEGRNLSIEEVYNVAEGRVWSGKQAVANGLADVNGGLTDAVAMAADLADLGSDYTLYEFSVARTPFEEWLNSLGGVVSVDYGVDMSLYGEEFLLFVNKYHELFTNSGIQAKVPYDINILF